MARSAGVTASAVVIFIGSALTLLFGALAVLGLALTSLHPVPTAPIHAGYIAIANAIFALGFAGWGIAAGIGLLNTKEWARVSTIVFAAMLALLAIPAALFMAFIPLPLPKDPNLPVNFALIIRLSTVLVYGLLGALAVFWLFFFNRRSVKEQFHRKRGQSEVKGLVPQPAPEIAVVGIESAATRPLSITVIAWFLLISSAFAPLSLLYSETVLRGVQIPFCFLGLFVSGWAAFLILLIWMAAQLIAAVGLLKLKNWARLAIIVLQCFGILNILLLVAVPANRIRFQHAMDAAMASMRLQMPQPVSFSFSIWIGMIASLPIFVVILWFLITRKQAFAATA